MTRICYLDESGAPERSHQGTHFVLLGVSIPAQSWRARDAAITNLKRIHRLGGAEIHTAWMARKFPEQTRIVGFEAMNDGDRRVAMKLERQKDLAKASLRGSQAVKLLAKNYRHTAAYTHLTYAERRTCLNCLADELASWTDCQIFADAQRKDAHAANAADAKIMDYAFQQIVTRFHHALVRDGVGVGILVQDRNDTAARRLTDLMRRYHTDGTQWASIDRIVETPLFVDSQLTSMVQLADLCSYATRRFFENNEQELFDRIYSRFDRANGRLVGLRHYTGKDRCTCRVCLDHGR